MLHRRLCKTRPTRRTLSFPQNDPDRAKIALLAPRHKTPACCLRRAHRRLNNNSSKILQGASSRDQSLSRVPASFLISKLMALPTPVRRRSWVLRCDQEAFPRESLPLHLTHSPLALNNSATKPRQWHQNMAHRNLISSCRACLKALTRTSRSHPRIHDRPPIRMLWQLDK